MWLISKTCQNENGSRGLFWSKHTWTSWMRYWESLSSVRYFSRHFTANSLTIGSGKLQSNNSMACSGLIAGQSFRRQYIWNEKRAAKYRKQILNNPVIHSCLHRLCLWRLKYKDYEKLPLHTCCRQQTLCVRFVFSPLESSPIDLGV